MKLSNIKHQKYYQQNHVVERKTVFDDFFINL